MMVLGGENGDKARWSKAKPQLDHVIMMRGTRAPFIEEKIAYVTLDKDTGNIERWRRVQKDYHKHQNLSEANDLL
jgi:hypothetical protein